MRFEEGLTIAELKDIIKDLPETNEYGEPCTVWIRSNNGLSNLVREVSPLNKRYNDDRTEWWSDLFLISNIE